jgi:hypothetical protein
MVPGGALSERFPDLGYERLKSYVRNGGTLIVFSQPKGISYSKLMEGVEAIGYEEDRTPNYMEVMIADDHEMFAGLLKRSFVMAVDGHFRKYPEKGRVYLKRAKLNQPVFLSTLLGKGTIIATTSFTPEEFENGSATEDEIVFFREVLNYFKQPMALPKIKAGQNVKLKLKVKNEDKEAKATKGVVMIYDPERAHQRFRKEFPINLKPGDSTFIEFTYPTCSTAPSGIWHTTYELMTEGYQFLTSEQEPRGVNVWLESLLQPKRDCLEGRFIVIK